MLLFISDLHADEDQRRIYWLAELVKQLKPDLLISLGDLGYEPDKALIAKLILSRVPLRAIYGNHDNVVWMENQFNFDGSRVLIEDGKIIEAVGFRLGFVNGIISRRRRSRRGVPRKRPEEFLEIARGLKGISILCIHEFPAPDELLDSGILHAPAFTAREAVRIVNPKLALCGHIHYYRVEPKVYHVGNTKLIVIDSTEKSYAILDKRKIRLMKNGKEILAVKL